MRRLFWLALGASVGVLVVRTVRRRAARLTPAGVSESVGGAVAGAAEAIRRLADEVRAASAEREAELIAALDLPAPAAPPAGAPAPSAGAGAPADSAAPAGRTVRPA